MLITVIHFAIRKEGSLFLAQLTNQTKGSPWQGVSKYHVLREQRKLKVENVIFLPPLDF